MLILSFLSLIRYRAVVYEVRLGRNREIMLGERGSEGEFAWNLPEEWKVSGLIVYGFAVRADGKNASGTLGLTRIWKIKTVKILVLKFAVRR